MKKVTFFGCLALFCMAISSCSTIKNATPLSSLSGEWNIIEINGKVVVPAPGQVFPYIAFDTNNGQVYGNTGCNRLTGIFNVAGKPGKIDLNGMGGTMMNCADMTVEHQVLQALAKVKKYKQLNNENMALIGSSKKDVIVLQRKQPDVSMDDLAGKWMITHAYGEEIPQGMEAQPFLEFNLVDKKMHGVAGCNIVNANLRQKEPKPTSLYLHNLIRTMMACPDMDVEDRVIRALRATRSFGSLAGGAIGFYDEDNNLVLIMKKS